MPSALNSPKAKGASLILGFDRYDLDRFQLFDPEQMKSKPLIQCFRLAGADLVEKVLFKPDLGRMHPFAG